MDDLRNWASGYDSGYLEQQVGELRSLFREEYNGNKKLYDERDYNRFMDPDDNYNARRWIAVHGDALNAFEMVRGTMRWRRELNLNDFSYEDFPLELYQLGCIFEYGHDKKGRKVLYIRCHLFKPYSEIDELNKKFVAFLIDQLDKRAKSDEFIMVCDLTGAGWNNIQVSMIKYMISLKERFPQESHQILLIGRSWIAKAIFKSVRSLIPANYIAVIKPIGSDDELLKYIDKNELPPFLKGTSQTRRFYTVPLKAKPTHNYEQFSKSFADRLRVHVESSIDSNDYEMVENMSVIR